MNDNKKNAEKSPEATPPVPSPAAAVMPEWDDEDDNTTPNPCSHGHCGHKHD